MKWLTCFFLLSSIGAFAQSEDVFTTFDPKSEKKERKQRRTYKELVQEVKDASFKLDDIEVDLQIASYDLLQTKKKAIEIQKLILLNKNPATLLTHIRSIQESDHLMAGENTGLLDLIAETYTKVDAKDGNLTSLAIHENMAKGYELQNNMLLELVKNTDAGIEGTSEFKNREALINELEKNEAILQAIFDNINSQRSNPNKPVVEKNSGADSNER